MARKPATKVAGKTRAKPEAPSAERVNHAFYVIRQFAIYAAAKLGMKTEEIAKKLGVNRSFVIRQTEIELKPRNGAERRVLKLAQDVVPQVPFARTMVGKLLGSDNVTTILAGGERPKLGPLADRRAAAKKAKAAPKAKTKAPAKKPAKAAAVKKAPAAKPTPSKAASPKRTPDAPKVTPTAKPAPEKKLPPQPKPKAPKEAPAATTQAPAAPAAKPASVPAKAPDPNTPLRRPQAPAAAPPARAPEPAPEPEQEKNPLDGLFGPGT